MFDFKFDWCKEMECGVPAIDDQHQILFHIGREMEQLIMHGCQNATTKELLDIVCELREYTSYHFYTEEDLMLKYNYPETDQHKQSHAVFRASIIDVSVSSLTLAVIGDESKAEAIQNLLREFGILELVRTCMVALERGQFTIDEQTKVKGEYDYGKNVL